jgi:hypothetical protein
MGTSNHACCVPGPRPCGVVERSLRRSVELSTASDRSSSSRLLRGVSGMVLGTSSIGLEGAQSGKREGNVCVCVCVWVCWFFYPCGDLKSPQIPHKDSRTRKILRHGDISHVPTRTEVISRLAVRFRVKMTVTVMVYWLGYMV